MENNEKALLNDIKKIKAEVRKLDNTSRNLESFIEEAKEEVARVKKYENSNDPRERMTYLDATRICACLKNDLVNTNLLITFKLDELEALQNKLKNLEQKEPAM